MVPTSQLSWVQNSVLVTPELVLPFFMGDTAFCVLWFWWRVCVGSGHTRKGCRLLCLVSLECFLFYLSLWLSRLQTLLKMALPCPHPLGCAVHSPLSYEPATYPAHVKLPLSCGFSQYGAPTGMPLASSPPHGMLRLCFSIRKHSKVAATWIMTP